MADDSKQVMINLQEPAPFAVLMDVNYHHAACQSPVCKSKKKEMLPAVQTVCVWALINAFVAAGFSVLTMILNRIPCTKSVPFFRCVALTPAAAAEASTLVHRQLWCSAPQAAAAVAALALLLPPLTGKRWRRSRWALAVAALAATASNHYMKLRRVSSFRAAAPGDAYLIADVVFGFLNLAVDLLCFLCLLLLGDGQE